MGANILVGLLAILFSLTLKKNNTGLKVAMVILTVFLAIRYNWGNDYDAYLLEYQDLNYGYSSIFDAGGTNRAAHNEAGWVAINRIFGLSGLGFFGLVIFLSIFENYTIYRIISKFVIPRYYPLAIFFYVFNTSFFAIGASMMRQFLCICLYFIVFELMVEKKVKRYLLYSIAIILLGTTIHRSNFFMLLSLPLYYVHFKGGRNYVITFLSFVLLFVVFELAAPKYFSDAVTAIVEGNDDYAAYADYIKNEGDAVGTGLGIVFRYLLLLFLFYVLPEIKTKEQSVVLLSIIPFFLYPLMNIIPLLSRYTYYFTYLMIILWPSLLYCLKKTKKVLMVLLIMQSLILIKGFVDFYHNPIWITDFFTYNTIFEAPNWM